MENAYGIGVKNRYAVFYDDDVDPYEVLKQREALREKKKNNKTNIKDNNKNTKDGKEVPTTGASKKTKDGLPANSQKPIETEASNKVRAKPFTDRTSRNFKSFDDSKEIEERKNFRNRENHGPSNFDARERDSDERGNYQRGFRGGPRGRGRGRGRGGFSNYDRPPRREFDRHSGSDKPRFRAFDKKEGSDSNTWGDVQPEPSTQEKDSFVWDPDFAGNAEQDLNWINPDQSPSKNIAAAKKGVNDSATEPGEIKEVQPSSEEQVEEAAKEMTLDEWKREQEAKRVVPKFNLRKPGEGEDGNQWKKLYVLKKKENARQDEEEEEEDDGDEDEVARRGRQRQFVDIQINFYDTRRGRNRGRGARGGFRGDRFPPLGKIPTRDDRRDPIGSGVGNRGYRGGVKSYRPGQQSAPKVDDWNDFPSLVTA